MICSLLYVPNTQKMILNSSFHMEKPPIKLITCYPTFLGKILATHTSRRRSSSILSLQLTPYSRPRPPFLIWPSVDGRRVHFLAFIDAAHSPPSSSCQSCRSHGNTAYVSRRRSPKGRPGVPGEELYAKFGVMPKRCPFVRARRTVKWPPGRTPMEFGGRMVAPPMAVREQGWESTRWI